MPLPRLPAPASGSLPLGQRVLRWVTGLIALGLTVLLLIAGFFIGLALLGLAVLAMLVLWVRLRWRMRSAPRRSTRRGHGPVVLDAEVVVVRRPQDRAQ